MEALPVLEKTNNTIMQDVVSAIPGIVYQYIIRPDGKGFFSFVSDGTKELLGVNPETVYGDESIIMKIIHPEDQWKFKGLLRSKNTSINIQFRVINAADAKEKWIQCTAKPQWTPDGCIIWNGVFLEIIDRKHTEAVLEHLSTHDQLTGVYNRNFFETELSKMERIYSQGTAIGVFDIDGLKLVNDTFGHAEGDRLLKAAALIIKNSLRSEDIFARIGGDEYAAILLGVGEAGTERICRKIREAVESQVAQQFSLPFSISIGFAIAGQNTKTLADVYKRAEDSMYREKLHHADSMRSKIVQALGMALEARDYVTDGHASRLQGMALMLAMAANVPENKYGDLRLLARFHDIGKVAIPDEILFKPGPLTPEENEIMRKHSEIGHRMALTLPDLVPIADWILKHHEWWNGRGYPLRISGENIPLECRIISIVDAYDCMVNDRPYRTAMPHKEAIAELRRHAGHQFDAELVSKFVALLEGQH